MDGTPLPFARGSTYCEGDTTAIANLDETMLGNIYSEIDPTTNKEVRLRVVKATAALTAPGGRGMKWDTGYLFDKTAGFVDAAGYAGLYCDPLQTTDVVSGDLFYCIWDGEVSGLKVDTTNLTLGGLVQFANNGYATPLGTADAVCIGNSKAAVTAGVAGAVTATLILQPPLSGQNAA